VLYIVCVRACLCLCSVLVHVKNCFVCVSVLVHVKMCVIIRLWVRAYLHAGASVYLSRTF